MKRRNKRFKSGAETGNMTLKKLLWRRSGINARFLIFFLINNHTCDNIINERRGGAFSLDNLICFLCIHNLFGKEYKWMHC